jgi:methylmalonyl-CoA mutase cobalamin-binding domain/chain
VAEGADVLESLTQELTELREEEALASTAAARDAGVPPAQIVAALQAGMKGVGEKYASGDYYLSELIMSAEIFKGALALVGATDDVESGPSKATIVVGTVSGDIHDIGKDIVVSVLRANGFRVVDLGVDVSPQRFVDAVREHKAPIVGLSCLLTTAFASMEATIGALREAGLREATKVMVGGGPITPEIAAMLGADGAGASAQDAVDMATAFAEGVPA